MPDNKPILIRAAEWLEQYASELQDSHTLRPDYRWPDNDEEDRQAHADYDELIEIAIELRAKHDADTHTED